MKAVLWPFKYDNMRASWCGQYRTLVTGLINNGLQVTVHPDIKCRGLEAPLYDYRRDNPTDICVYNHGMQSDLMGNILPAKQNWFWKPCGPTPAHATLDTMGYGPYMSVGYQEPPYGLHVIPEDFADTVQNWIATRTCKWKGTLTKVQKPEKEDYHLVIGQMPLDTVNTVMDFGCYITKLYAVVRELIRVDPDRHVVVKLHPNMDGIDHKYPQEVTRATNNLLNIDSRVSVVSGLCNVHPFIEKARDVILANSGAGLEVMMHGKPIICWGKPEYHWVSYDLRHLCDMHRALELDWFEQKRQWRWLSWFCNEFCISDEASATRRVKELIRWL